MNQTKKILAGDEYPPNVPEAELESMIAAIPNCKEILRILTADRTETIGLWHWHDILVHVGRGIPLR